MFVSIVLTFVRLRRHFLRHRLVVLASFVGSTCLCLLFYFMSVDSVIVSMNYVPDDIPAFKLLSAAAKLVHKQTHPFMLSNSYGLFRQMTGLKGTPVITLTAKAVDFKSGAEKSIEVPIEGKLGDLNYMPGVYIPCQRRLAWQFWFSALEPNPMNIHFLSTIYKIMQSNESYNGEVRLETFEGLQIDSLTVSKHLYRFNNDTAAQTIWKREEDTSFQPV